MGIFLLSLLYDTRMVHMGVLVCTWKHIHTDTLSQTQTHTQYRLILFYLWPGNGSSAMSG